MTDDWIALAIARSAHYQDGARVAEAFGMGLEAVRLHARDDIAMALARVELLKGHTPPSTDVRDTMRSMYHNDPIFHATAHMLSMLFDLYLNQAITENPYIARTPEEKRRADEFFSGRMSSNLHECDFADAQNVLEDYAKGKRVLNRYYACELLKGLRQALDDVKRLEKLERFVNNGYRQGNTTHLSGGGSLRTTIDLLPDSE